MARFYDSEQLYWCDWKLEKWIFLHHLEEEYLLILSKEFYMDGTILDNEVQ